MSSALLNITFDCADPRTVATFWAAVTGWPVTEEPNPGSADCAVQPPEGGGPRLYFVSVPDSKAVKNRLHLDIVPADRTQDEEIARLGRLGARVVTDPRPELGWVVLADPEGNEFCVEISAAELGSDM
jgi:predicted enzyme related to lactoylglutathione lyase